jgi:hypothetical protein
VSVNGAPGSVLGVMSQGEVNALALAVFLPRARLPARPFRFLVIDDPVQAMNPAKMDGLARVLEKAAADRQVIMFTHDNRLAEAVRQLRLPATVLEVARRPGSVVEVRSAWTRYSRRFANVRRHLPGAQPRRARCSYGRSRPADPRHPGARGQDPCEPAVTSEELLAAARRLVEHPDAGTAGVWPRAAALLAQALERAMAGLWAGRQEADGLSGGMMRPQLLCLTAYVNEDVATRAAYLSAALSRVCHHHPYELAPTASELTRWPNETADLVALLRSRAGTIPGSSPS